jgi:hypothetical protein
MFSAQRRQKARHLFAKDACESAVSGFLGSACRRAAERLHGSVTTLPRFPG